MDFYDVLHNRRTVRSFSDKKVEDATLERILSAAFHAPTSDISRRIEFVVIRGYRNIARIISAGATGFIGDDGHDASLSKSDKIPSQHGMLLHSNCLVLPFFHQSEQPLLYRPKNQQSLNDFASAWAAVENVILAAANEGLQCSIRIPTIRDAENAKRLVCAPPDYEFACFLGIGYASSDRATPERKDIDTKKHIHNNIW